MSQKFIHEAINDCRRALTGEGARYGVVDYFGPWPTPPVFAWFVAEIDAHDFAGRTGCTVWDLVEGAIVPHPVELPHPSGVPTIEYEGRVYRKFIHWPAPVDDGTPRCISCGQIDEIEVHDNALCPPFRGPGGHKR